MYICKSRAVLYILDYHLPTVVIAAFSLLPRVLFGHCLGDETQVLMFVTYSLTVSLLYAVAEIWNSTLEEFAMLYKVSVDFICAADFINLWFWKYILYWYGCI